MDMERSSETVFFNEKLIFQQCTNIPFCFLDKDLPERCTRTGQRLPLENRAMDGGRTERETHLPLYRLDLKINFIIYFVKTSQFIKKVIENY